MPGGEHTFTSFELEKIKNVRLRSNFHLLWEILDINSEASTAMFEII